MMFMMTTFRLLIILIIMMINFQKGCASETKDIKSGIISSISSKTSHFGMHEEVFDLNQTQQVSARKKIGLGLVEFIGAGVIFSLEVLGATGAFWGASDVF